MSQSPPPPPPTNPPEREPSTGAPVGAPPEGTTWARGDAARSAPGYPPPDYPGYPYPGGPGPAATSPLPQPGPGPWGGAPGQPWPAPQGQPDRAAGHPGLLRRIPELLLVALLAAALAAGGTWALVRDQAPRTVEGGGRIVEQADPSNPSWTATAKAVGPSVVSIQVGSGRGGGQGSGVITDAKGYVVTNNHVVAGAGANPKITVALDDRRIYDAKILGADPETDLAVLQLVNSPSDLKAIALGDDTKLKVGDPVMAVGNPLGLAGTVTTGIVSALNRPVRTQGEGANAATTVVTNAIQTSAAINPGNSGGALVNSAGQLVGINSSIASLSQSSGNIGIGFAIPVNEVKNVSEQLITTGKARHAQLGVQVGDTVVADGPDRRAVASIQSTVDGGPAQKSGLKAGDAVLSVDGEIVDGASSLQAQIRERQVGDQVTLLIIRDGKRQELKVTLGERS